MLKHNRTFYLISVMLALFVSIYYHVYGASYAQGQAHILLLISYGGVVSWDGLFILSALAFCLPFFMQLFLFANSINNEFNIACVYIFPRKANRIKWLFVNYYKIALHSIIYYLVQFFTVIIIALLLGYSVDILNLINVFIILFLTLVITNSVITLITCMLSLRNNTSIVVSMFIAVYFACIFFLPNLKDIPSLLPYIPFTHAIALYHDLPINGISSLSPPIDCISVWQTIAYMACIMVILLIISSLWIKKANLMEVNSK